MRVSSSGRARLIASTLVASMLFGGCSDADSDDPERRSGGPLTSQLFGGGNSLAAPRGPATWSTTFGSLLICSDEQVTLSQVEPHYRDAVPIEISFDVRAVPGRAERVGEQRDWAPVLARKVSLEQLLKGQVRAASITPAEGAVIDQPCYDDPDQPYTEIVTSMTVDHAGVWIDRLDISYQAGGKTYDLPIDWNYVACGTSISDTDVC